MTATTDKFRSSTSGWLRGSLAGWATLLLCLVGVGQQTEPCIFDAEPLI